MDDNLDLSLSLFTRPPPYRPVLPPPPSTADHLSAAIDGSTVDTTLSLRSTAHAYSHQDNNYNFLPSTSFAAAADINGVAMDVNDDGTLPLISLLGCSASASEYMAISPPPTPQPQPPTPYQDVNSLFLTLQALWLIAQTAACFSSFYSMHPEASRDFQVVNTEPATNLALVSNSTTNNYCNGSATDGDNEATSASPS